MIAKRGTIKVLYRGNELAYVDNGSHGRAVIPRETYDLLGYDPPFDELITFDEWWSAAETGAQQEGLPAENSRSDQ